MTCQLCEAINEKYRIFKENKSAFAMIIIEPLLEGHSLILPKRHITDLKSLTAEESKDLHELILEVRERMDAVFECDSMAVLNGKGNTSQCHIHYQILPLKNRIDIRMLISKTLNVPERVRLPTERLREMADRLRD